MPVLSFTSIQKLFRPGIRIKLFLAIVAVCAVMAVSMSVATRVSFQSGFFEYLTEIEQNRISGLAEELAEDYKQQGNWKNLSDSRNWRRKILRFTRKSAMQQAGIDLPPPPQPPEKSAASGQSKKKNKGKKPPSEPQVDLPASEQARHVWESAHLRSSLGLFDADKSTLIAGVQPGPEASWLPIEVENKTVGWLTREPLTGITDSIDLRFHEQQRTAILIIAGIGILLAAAAAMIMAHYLIAPLRRFADTTGRLAAGDFSARVIPPERKSLVTLLKSSLLRFRETRPWRGKARAGKSTIQSKRKKNPMAVPRPAPRVPWQGDELQVLAKQLNHLGGVLEQNERARRNFLAEIAHDLRTPLAILKGEIEALEDGVREVTPESLASLRAEVDLLGRLVDDIHTLSLADVGMLKYDLSVFDIVPCLASALYATKERMQSRALTLDAVLPQNAVPVYADPARLGQVFRNVLENSLRYTDSGGVVQVRCHEDGKSILIDILDSSPGVPDEQLSDLFERFRTWDAARNRGKSGSGLGLAISRTLIETQGGEIRALPSPLGGVWIRIQLPLAGRNALHE